MNPPGYRDIHHVTGEDFSGALILGSRFDNVRFRKCNFKNALCIGIEWSYSRFTQCDMRFRCNYRVSDAGPWRKDLVPRNEHEAAIEALACLHTRDNHEAIISIYKDMTGGKGRVIATGGLDYHVFQSMVALTFRTIAPLASLFGAVGGTP